MDHREGRFEHRSVERPSHIRHEILSRFMVQDAVGRLLQIDFDQLVIDRIVIELEEKVLARSVDAPARNEHARPMTRPLDINASSFEPATHAMVEKDAAAKPLLDPLSPGTIGARHLFAPNDLVAAIAKLRRRHGLQHVLIKVNKPMMAVDYIRAPPPPGAGS